MTPEEQHFWARAIQSRADVGPKAMGHDRVGCTCWRMTPVGGNTECPEDMLVDEPLLQVPSILYQDQPVFPVLLIMVCRSVSSSILPVSLYLGKAWIIPLVWRKLLPTWTPPSLALPMLPLREQDRSDVAWRLPGQEERS